MTDRLAGVTRMPPPPNVMAVLVRAIYALQLKLVVLQ